MPFVPSCVRPFLYFRNSIGPATTVELFFFQHFQEFSRRTFNFQMDFCITTTAAASAPTPEWKINFEKAEHGAHHRSVSRFETKKNIRPALAALCKMRNTHTHIHFAGIKLVFFLIRFVFLVCICKMVGVCCVACASDNGQYICRYNGYGHGKCACFNNMRPK